MNTLEELVPEVLETVAAWLSKQEINQWLTSDWRDRKVDSKTLALVVRNKRNRLFLVKHQGQACGLVGLADIDQGDRTGMVWYVLGEHALSSRGIMTDAVKQLVKTAFVEFGLASLYAWIMEDNLRSRRVLEKAGFREAGRIRKATYSSGAVVDRIYFDILPEPDSGSHFG